MLTIAHPTQARDDESSAFEHAAALALRVGGSVVSVHVGSGAESVRMPDSESLASRWGAEPFEHKRLVRAADADDLSEDILAALREIWPDMIVAGTHRRGPVARILTESHAEAIAGNIDVPSLLVPDECRGIVASDTGALTVGRILVPIGDAEEARAAIDAALWFTELVGQESAELELLRVGDAPPALTLPDRAGTTYRHVQKQGSLTEAIAAAAESADLLVMATRGHDSVDDVVVGSQTERALRLSSCPVLSVRVGAAR